MINPVSRDSNDTVLTAMLFDQTKNKAELRSLENQEYLDNCSIQGNTYHYHNDYYKLIEINLANFS